MQVLRAAGYFAVPEGEPNQYREHLRTAGMSVGTYCIPVGGKDDQQQHGQDELYVIVRGRAKLLTDEGMFDVGPGMVIHVAAYEVHQFTDVSDDLSALVVFAPPERLNP